MKKSGIRPRCAARALDAVRQNLGITTFSPLFIADSCAQMPTIVQLTEVSASGIGGRSPRQASRKLCDQVRVRAAVAAALEERQVVGVLNRRRLREPADRLRQQVRVVGHLDPLRDLRLAERRLRRCSWCG